MIPLRFWYTHVEYDASAIVFDTVFVFLLAVLGVYVAWRKERKS